MPRVKKAQLWDIFCRVIDNYGDIGVCWRLAADLARRGELVRLWVDDARPLQWMAPQPLPGVQQFPWSQSMLPTALPPADILIEAFGCEIAPEYIQHRVNRAGAVPPVWLNLEYLSAEGFVARNHGLPSPVMSGPGRGLIKYFYYPGFTAASGGLLRETDLAERQRAFEREPWLRQLGLRAPGEQLLSMFCYEPAALGDLLSRLAQGTVKTRMLVTFGRASAAVAGAVADKNRAQPDWNRAGRLGFAYLPALSQTDYDHLLWACDLNFVRGEDSLVRAIWAGKPLVWEIYPQRDGAHEVKLQAFLDQIEAPASLRKFHSVWNSTSSARGAALPILALAEWQTSVLAARKALLKLDDLTSQLLRFVSKSH